MSCSFRCAFLWLFWALQLCSDGDQRVTLALPGEHRWILLHPARRLRFAGCGETQFPSLPSMDGLCPSYHQCAKSRLRTNKVCVYSYVLKLDAKELYCSRAVRGRAAEWQELESEKGCCKQSQPKNDFELFTVYTRHCHSSKLERDVVQQQVGLCGARSPVSPTAYLGGVRSHQRSRPVLRQGRGTKLAFYRTDVALVVPGGATLELMKLEEK